MADPIEPGDTRKLPDSEPEVRAAPPVVDNVIPVIGEQVGKYIVERVVGTGGMGIVVGARHEETGERVAIKLLHPKAAQDRIQLERFLREARAISRVKSEHVVRVIDVGAQQGTERPFIVMDFLVGKDLGKILHDKGPLPWQIAVDYVLQACEGIASAHASGIVHRDLKPSNFFLTQRTDGSPLVKVLDFGISKAAGPEAALEPKLTETTAVFGSPTYMSPEQIRSSKNVDARSDVWSTGVALYELLTGRLPFMADNVPGLLASIIADPPIPMSKLVKDIPRDLELIILACLEKDIETRVQSIADFAHHLRPFASPETNLLIDRIEKLGGRMTTGSHPALGSKPSVPPTPSIPPPPAALAPPVVAPSARVSAVPQPPSPTRSTAPPPSPRPLPAVPQMPTSFGTTDTDLSSATGMSDFRREFKPEGRRKKMVAAVLVIGAISVVGSVVLLVSLADDKPPPTTTNGAQVPSATAPAETTPPPTPTPSVSAPPPTPIKPPKGGKPKNGHKGPLDSRQ